MQSRIIIFMDLRCHNQARQDGDGGDGARQGLLFRG